MGSTAQATKAKDPTKLTCGQEILLAASTLDTFFSESSLVVAVWNANKTYWGLAGYRDTHPDSNKVRWRLSGQKGLVKQGWLPRQGSRLYLSERAKDEVARIKSVLNGEDLGTVRAGLKRPELAENTQILIQAQVRSTAFVNWIMNAHEMTRFDHALEFWCLSSPYYEEEVVEGRFNKIDEAYRDAYRCMIRKEVVLSDGFSLTKDKLEQLKCCQAALCTKFYKMFK